MKRPAFFFIWLMLLAIGLMCVITITQVITNRSQKALEEGNQQAASTFTLNNRLEELVNLSFSIENRMLGIINKKNVAEINKDGLKDSLTQLGYNVNILQLSPVDTANYNGLNKVAYFINKQIDYCFKIIENANSKTAQQKLYTDSLVNMHLGDSIYLSAIAFQKKLEKFLHKNLQQNNTESNRLGALNFMLAIISLLAILLLVMIIIRRQKNQLLLIKDLKEARVLALRSGEVKDRFMANMSHEIRTPLNALQGFSRLLSQSNLGKEQRRYSNIIYTASENLLTIVNDILDFSKIESDSLPIRKEFFNLKRELKEIQIMFETLAAEKGLTLKISTDKKIKTALYGDCDRIKQILVNLIGNAIKFTNEGTISLTTTVLEETETSVKINFCVNDTGIGIPEKNLENIFERFEQIDNSFSRNQGGTGLGLAIVKKLIQLMGGEIQVSSKLNEGSAFNVQLSFEKQNDAFVLEEKYEGVTEKILFKGKTILVAEDNRMNQLLIESILEKFETYPIIAQNGYEALKCIVARKPDLILMDVQMPGMDGIAATKAIREKYGNDIPIVAMTAHVLEQEKQNCLQAGMNKYLIKPINEAALIATINELIGELNMFHHSTLNDSPTIEFTHIEYLKNICNNDVEKILEVLKQLALQIPEEIGLLENFIAHKNIDGLKKLMHNFKSTLSALDADAPAVIALDEFNYLLQQDHENAFNQNNVSTLLHPLNKCVVAINKLFQRNQ